MEIATYPRLGGRQPSQRLEDPISTVRVSAEVEYLVRGRDDTRSSRPYLIDLDATQAAIRADYSRKNADVTGSRLLRKVGIVAHP